MPTKLTSEQTAGADSSEGVRLVRALRHLNQLLPLKYRQASLSPATVKIHRSILRSWAELGRPPKREEIATMMGSEVSAVNALAVLGSNDLVVLNSAVTKHPATKKVIIHDPNAIEIIGAYPFTRSQTPHKVTLFGHEIFAMCALDALAIAPMFNTETRIDSKCHVTGRAIRTHQKGMQILDVSPTGLQFGVRWQGAATTAAHGI